MHMGSASEQCGLGCPQLRAVFTGLTPTGALQLLMALLEVWMLWTADCWSQPQTAAGLAWAPAHPEGPHPQEWPESPKVVALHKEAPGGGQPREWHQGNLEWAKMWPEVTQHDGWPPFGSLTPCWSQLLSPPASAPCPNLLPPALLSYPVLSTSLALTKVRSMISE